jgi:mRNA-degrading endonuclease RelE of RelBE toxin-antitoxin system
MVEIKYTPAFSKSVRKTRPPLREHVEATINKIIENPLVGKPLRYEHKGERSVRTAHYRILYLYADKTITFLDFNHRKGVY